MGPGKIRTASPSLANAREASGLDFRTQQKPRFLSEARFHFGGDKRDRTADLLHAMQALSQLSYTPIYSVSSGVLCQPTCIEYHGRGILSSGF